jgi:hypothetical protein
VGLEFLNWRADQKMKEHGDQRRSDPEAKESWQVMRYLLRDPPIKVRWA